MDSTRRRAVVQAETLGAGGPCSIRAPTIVLHGRGDLRAPFEEGRLVAGLIPGARFVTLETRNHLMMQDEPAWRAFLGVLADFYPPAQVPANAFPILTARERQVLELLATGMTNAEIAKRLYLGDATVKTHVARLLGKLGARDRLQATIIAYESGFIRPGG